MSTTKLSAPCPFVRFPCRCGHVAVHYEIDWADRWTVVCSGCGHRGQPSDPRACSDSAWRQAAQRWDDERARFHVVL